MSILTADIEADRPASVVANIIGNITEERPCIKSSHFSDGENAVFIVVADLDPVVGYQNRRPIDPLELEWSSRGRTVESD